MATTWDSFFQEAGEVETPASTEEDGRLRGEFCIEGGREQAPLVVWELGQESREEEGQGAR